MNVTQLIGGADGLVFLHKKLWELLQDLCSKVFCPALWRIWCSKGQNLSSAILVFCCLKCYYGRIFLSLCFIYSPFYALVNLFWNIHCLFLNRLLIIYSIPVTVPISIYLYAYQTSSFWCVYYAIQLPNSMLSCNIILFWDIITILPLMKATFSFLLLS